MNFELSDYAHYAQGGGWTQVTTHYKPERSAMTEQEQIRKEIADLEARYERLAARSAKWGDDEDYEDGVILIVDNVIGRNSYRYIAMKIRFDRWFCGTSTEGQHYGSFQWLQSRFGPDCIISIVTEIEELG